jgi:hypothetical protein
MKDSASAQNIIVAFLPGVFQVSLFIFYHRKTMELRLDEKLEAR